MKRHILWVLLGSLAAVPQTLKAHAAEPDWPQFRGPNGQGVAPHARVPVHFGPETNVLWKVALPAGHSSPVLWSDRIFLTASDSSAPQELLTLSVRRNDGAVLWRKAVPAGPPVTLHSRNHPASPTPAADADHVYAYFGTYGLVCYGHAGNPIWERRLDAPPSKYGMATSPIHYRDTVLMVLDGDDGRSRLLAVRKKTGETVWERARPLFKAGWSTPMIFHHDGRDELVVLGSRRLTAYAPSTGEELWWAGGFPYETVGVPVAGEGLVIAGAAALGGRGDDALDAAATWNTTVAAFDANHDGQIQREEMTQGFAFIQRPELPRDDPGYGLPVWDMDVLLGIFDHDKNRVISEAEWMRTMAGFAAISHPTLMAIRAGATNDARPSHLAWTVQRGVPETPSPLYHRGRLYLIRDGGLLTCLEAASGKERYRERIGAAGQYIASPVVAGDLLIVASVAGVVSVIATGDALQVQARNDFKEPIVATPAVADTAIYVRTAGHLYALGTR